MGLSERHPSSRKPGFGPPDQRQRGEAARSNDEREQNAAKYRQKVEELNRSRDVEIERALSSRTAR